MLRTWTTILTLLFAVGVFASDSDDSRGVKRRMLSAKTTEGRKIELYGGSHALLIGASKYSTWSQLPSIKGELDDVENALTATGFEVHRLTDPDASALKSGIEDFINSFGYDPDNRLIIYFSGHGHTFGQKGFLLPVDIPMPEERQNFRRKALPMTQILAWAKDIEAKHALFVFDSCFSGSVFKSKNMPTAEERYIRDATTKPVRQFITAGSANEEVPAKSTFTPAFVAAIQGAGDLNKDGYITGSELGVHLSQTVPRYVEQTPQYGKIRDYDLSLGDFVFFHPSYKQKVTTPAPQTPQLEALPKSTLEALVWQSAEKGNSVEDYLAYLDKFPEGLFTGLAKNRVSKLRRSLPLDQSSKIENKFPFQPELVTIPAGAFAMGSSVGRENEQPVRVVNISAFEISKFEITFEQFDVFTDAIASEQIDDLGWGRGKKPAINISWEAALDYIDWLNTKTGKSFRLPTEAEWEYVARAGKNSLFTYGDDVDRLCDYGNIANDNKVCTDNHAFTAPVGAYEPNEFGVFDLHGNVREWVSDCWHPNYIGAPTNGRARTSNADCTFRVVRGGAWYSMPNMQRTSVRNKMRVVSRGNGTGFRIARSLQ